MKIIKDTFGSTSTTKTSNNLDDKAAKNPPVKIGFETRLPGHRFRLLPLVPPTPCQESWGSFRGTTQEKTVIFGKNWTSLNAPVSLVGQLGPVRIQIECAALQLIALRRIRVVLNNVNGGGSTKGERKQIAGLNDHFVSKAHDSHSRLDVRA